MSEQRPMFWPPSTNGSPIPYGSTLGDLVSIVQGPWPECWSAYPALARDGSEGARKVLVEQTGSADWRHRRLAIKWLGACATPAEHALLLKFTADVNEYVRKEAIQACGVARARGSLPRLVELLRSPSVDERAYAAEALGCLGDAGAVAPLEAAALREPDERVRRVAMVAFLRTVDQSACWRELFEMLRTDHLGRHRQWACELASAFGDAAALSALEMLRADKDGHVRNAAERAISAVNARCG